MMAEMGSDMVFYFTATGNSMYVARQLEENAVSIPQAIHGTLQFKAEIIGVVCPVYGHEMPAMVKDFLKRAVFDTGYFYLVLTYGRIHGGAAELAETYLMGVGKKADYINTIMMVDNYLPGFDMNEQIAMDAEKKVDEHIAAIRSDIEGKRRWKQEITQADRDWHQKFLERQSGVPADFWANLYQVTEECIGCGICMRVCPAGCIELKEQHAVHIPADEQGNIVCQTCMACIHHCPKNAIRLTMSEKNPDARYRNEHIRLPEIVAANNQNK